MGAVEGDFLFVGVTIGGGKGVCLLRTERLGYGFFVIWRPRRALGGMFVGHACGMLGQAVKAVVPVATSRRKGLLAKRSRPASEGWCDRHIPILSYSNSKAVASGS